MKHLKLFLLVAMFFIFSSIAYAVPGGNNNANGTCINSTGQIKANVSSNSADFILRGKAGYVDFTLPNSKYNDSIMYFLTDAVGQVAIIENNYLKVTKTGVTSRTGVIFGKQFTGIESGYCMDVIYSIDQSVDTGGRLGFNSGFAANLSGTDRESSGDDVKSGSFDFGGTEYQFSAEDSGFLANVIPINNVRNYSVTLCKNQNGTAIGKYNLYNNGSDSPGFEHSFGTETALISNISIIPRAAVMKIFKIFVYNGTTGCPRAGGPPPPPDTTPPSITLINLTSEGGLGQIISTELFDFCYQESANVSTVCGGLNTGNYNCVGDWADETGHDCNLAFDEDWISYGGTNIGDSDLYINYTKSSNAFNSSLWQIKDFGATINLTLEKCWNSYSDKLSFRATSKQSIINTSWYCWNSSDWYLMRVNAGASRIYEEAMWWNVSAIIPKTSDTTPTFFAKTDENSNCAVIDNNRNLNYTDITKGSAECSTTGTMVHTCTLPDANATTIGLRNFSIGCKDTIGNENLTSTSGLFYVNITDGVPPNVTIFKPLNRTVFGRDTNLTSTIQFNFTVSDNFDTTLSNVSLFIDNALFFNTTNYKNGTLFQANISYNITGVHNWTINATDSFNNKNGSKTFTFSIVASPYVNLFLDGSSNSRKYELGLFQYYSNGTEKPYMINISLQCDVNVCLDYDYLLNIDGCSAQRDVLLNRTFLNITTFANNTALQNITSGTFINFSINNRTELKKVGFRPKGENVGGYPTDISIDLNSDNKKEVHLLGRLKDTLLEQTAFISLGSSVSQADIIFLGAVSKTIQVNFTGLFNVLNYSFLVSGVNPLDGENEFNSSILFNWTNNYNNTLSCNASAPLGTLRGGWLNDGTPLGTSLAMSLTRSVGACGSFDSYLYYNNSEGDLRDTTSVVVNFKYKMDGGGCGDPGNCNPSEVGFQLLATDGTTKVIILSNARTVTNTYAVYEDALNITLIQVSPTSTTYYLYHNGSVSGTQSSGSTFNIDTLDPTKRIYLKAYVYGQTSGDDYPRCVGINSMVGFNLIRWGGVWLNYSTIGDVYTTPANFTSNIVNITKTNVSVATLTALEFKPTGTSINYYLSNTCNNSNPTFEIVTSDQPHTFGTVGNYVCWRAILSGSNFSLPVVKRITISVIEGTNNNFSVDIGADGTIEFSYPYALNASNSPISVNGSVDSFNDYRTSNCVNALTCTYPIRITSGGPSLFTVQNMSIATNVTEITFTDLSAIETKNIFNVTFTFTGGTKLLVTSPVIEFYGNFNKTIVAHNSDYSNKSNLTIQFIHTRYNLTYPTGIIEEDTIPLRATQSNVEPLGQKNNTPIWTFIVHNDTENKADVYIRINDTLNSCARIKASVNYTGTTAIVLNSSVERRICNNASSCGVYMFSDLTACTTWLNPIFVFNTVCEECYINDTGLIG